MNILYGNIVIRPTSCGVLTLGKNHYQEKYGMVVGTGLTWAIKLGYALLNIALLAVLLLCVSRLAHADSFQLGKSTRAGDFETAYTLSLGDRWGIQGEYIDLGKQPDNIQNINRTVNLDATYRLPLGSWFLEGKAGLTSSRLSRNGCSVQHGDTDEHIRYRNRSGLTGWNVGLGLGYALNGRWSLHTEAIRLRYQQADKPEFEGYTFVYAGVRVEW